MASSGEDYEIHIPEHVAAVFKQKLLGQDLVEEAADALERLAKDPFLGIRVRRDPYRQHIAPKGGGPMVYFFEIKREPWTYRVFVGYRFVADGKILLTGVDIYNAADDEEGEDPLA